MKWVLLTGVLALTSCAKTPSLTGQWTGTQGTLDNGEQERTYLQLQQSGNQLTGKLETLSFQKDIHGTVNGNHFELMSPWDPSETMATGDLVGKDLHVQWDHNTYVLTPATTADQIPAPPYITPPPLQKVPYNGLAKKPPMGWNSWNLFASKVDDQIVRTMADAMVSSGMRDAGYIYVNIDDTWEGTRDAQGNIQTNHKFPDMKALADYVHSKGLKLGIYSGPGPRTCAGYPASYGHEEQDAKTYAAWGIDYLKYDWCSAGDIYNNSDLQPVYQKMGQALEQTHRPIVFSLCEYGLGDPWKWGPDVGGNLWRTTGDISDNWASMIGNAHKQIASTPYGGPGHWDDPDMLEVGNGGMTNDEYQTHMGLWSLLAAPLLAGNDIRNMNQATKDILLNKEVIAIDQDPLGKQAARIAQDGDTETWLKPLADGGVAVGVINLGSQPAQVTVKAADLKLAGPITKARDLWKHQDVHFQNGAYSEQVPTHGMLMLRVSARK